jgi:hypothetical protein
MGSTSNTSGSGTVSTLIGGILFGVGIIIIATGKLLQYVVYGLGQRSPATAELIEVSPLFHTIYIPATKSSENSASRSLTVFGRALLLRIIN